jgi:hypothetical protein
MIRIARGGLGRFRLATILPVVVLLVTAGAGGRSVAQTAPVEPLVIPATVEPPGPALAAPIAGALTALLPLAVGGALVAQDDRPDRQRAGTYVVLTGFAAAPWVAHAGAGRWRRALVYGLGSLALSAGAAVAMRAEDAYNPDIVNRDRLPFTVLLTTAFFAAAAGVIDGFIVSSLDPSDRRGGERR